MKLQAITQNSDVKSLHGLEIGATYSDVVKSDDVHVQSVKSIQFCLQQPSCRIVRNVTFLPGSRRNRS